MLGKPAGAAELWVALHGYGQVAERFVRRFRTLPGLADGRRSVVAPEALNRFYVENRPGEHGPASRVGATWMTRADREREIQDYVGYLDSLLGHVSPDGSRAAHVLLGFSQGAETASRWAVLGARSPGSLILWGGGLAEDLDPARTAEALHQTRIVFVVGDEDGWAQRRSSAGLELLRREGLEPERIEYPGGHRLGSEVLARNWP